MPNVRANGITLNYETFGDPKNPPVLLVMGLASQSVRWPEEFCQDLADNGFFCIRFDNRDVGLSARWDKPGAENVGALIAKAFGGEKITPPYTLSDMALDAVGLMDALGLEKAHICGLSMGGMIAQTVAIEHPDRVLSLTSMQSTPSNHNLYPSTPEAMERLISQPPRDREGYITHTVKSFTVFAGGSPLFDPEWEARKAGEQFDRGMDPAGVARQFLAVIMGENRTEKLGEVKAPSLVIHGSTDTLLVPAHGKATANAIPGARLLLVENMGHGMGFPALWEEVAAEIIHHLKELD